MSRRITILGATGSVGRSTLSLMGEHRERFRVDTLTANTDVEGLAELARRHGARHAVVAQESRYLALKEALAGTGIEAAAGQEALCEAASRPVDIVMAAIVGVAGLAPALAAVRSQPVVALANKESLVCAGALFMSEVRRCGTLLLPVDSEHSAILQALGGPAFLADPALDAVQDLIITGSGGPFRNRKAADLRGVSVEEAVNHPVWSMGAKISIDSATLMNKTLELIEAKYLFSVPAARLKVLIHPQSIVHGLVRFKDGSVLAQMATPDMRVPIAVALAWPRRIATPMADLDLAALATLTFEEPDTGRFPALRLAREVLNCSGTSAAIVNAANEFAVDAFMRGELRFTDIVAVCEETLARHERTGFGEPQSLEEALDIDRQARAIAAQCVAAGARGQGGASVGAAAAR